MRDLPHSVLDSPSPLEFVSFPLNKWSLGLERWFRGKRTYGFISDLEFGSQYPCCVAYKCLPL